MDVINDIFYTNKKIFKKTLKTVFNSQELFLIGIPYILSVIIIGYFITGGVFGFFTGMVMIAFLSALISDYLYVIEYILNYRTFSWKAFKVGYKVYFRNVFGMFFIIYLVNSGVDLFIAPIFRIIPFGGLFLILLKLMVIVVFNTLPEVFYQKKYDELDSLTYSMKFLKKNIMDWFVPNVLLGIIVFYFYKMLNSLISNIFASNESLGFAFNFVIIALFLQIFIGFIFVYRGYLFEELDNNSRKKRLFKRHM